MNKIKENPKKILVVKNLIVSYGKEANYLAVNNVSLSVNERDFFGIIGESGSGKTTLGKAIIRLVVPTSGQILINNHIVSDKKISRVNRHWLTESVQMIFQNPSGSMNPVKTILQIIAEPLTINSELLKSAIKYIWKIQLYRKYCKNEFSMRHFELYWAFQMNYLSRTKTRYEHFFDQLCSIKQTTELSKTELIKKLDQNLQDFVENKLKDMNTIYAFIKNNEDAANEHIRRCERGQLVGMDLTLQNAAKKMEIKKRNARFSFECQRKITDARKVKNKIAHEKITFHNKNIKFKQTLLLNWKSAIRINLKKYSHLLKISQDEFSFMLNKIDYVKWKHLYCFWRWIRRIPNLNANNIANLITFLENKHEEIYLPLRQIILEDQKTFFQKKLDASLAFNQLYALKKIVNRLCWHLNFYLVNPTIAVSKVLVALNEKISSYNSVFNIQGFYLHVLKIEKQVASEIKQSEISGTLNKMKFEKKIVGFKSKLRKLKNEFRLLKKKRDSNEKFQAKKNYLESKQEFLKAKKKWHEEFKNVYMKKWEMFCYNKQKITSDISKQSQQISQLHTNCVKLINSITKQILTDENKGMSEQNDANDQQNLYKNIQTKLNRINALDDKFESLVNSTRIYWRLFRWKFLFPWLLLRKIIQKKKQDAVFNALKIVGLRYEHAFRYPHEFSGGQKQRIVIARALIAKPKLIIADEPISALDVSIQAQIINLMNKLNRKLGVTFLFIAHDLSVIKHVCNKIIIMHRGRALERGNTEEIFHRPIHPYTRSLLAAVPKLSRIHLNLSNNQIKLDYDQAYSVTNKPDFRKIPNDLEHEVFATKDQLTTWLKDQQTKQ